MITCDKCQISITIHGYILLNFYMFMNLLNFYNVSKIYIIIHYLIEIYSKKKISSGRYLNKICSNNSEMFISCIEDDSLFRIPNSLLYDHVGIFSSFMQIFSIPGECHFYDNSFRKHYMRRPKIWIYRYNNFHGQLQWDYVDAVYRTKLGPTLKIKNRPNVAALIY